ncbi:1-deoxy-D-xylulose-5-phosphate synthase [Nocardia panacis]|uniref:1-deoxy-D-xylulose-5-phosphate synthase n=1 Tax=Nocardia panacis TaxID=2340916 RepID=A0A3A4K3B7_9NOCA|nr:1-deoxy-D-xylulose-5-phosphate synthase [Nocardia panacis]RJO71004.1 1-deoxy-D-xylulose-5-phosphate synthase [Nocardia panacis]
MSVPDSIAREPGASSTALAGEPLARVNRPLAGIHCAEDVRDLPADQLPILAEQIRQLLLDTVLAGGGHLGPNLGVVELTIALHRVFQSPEDFLLFDTGHQTYVHKMLTGRWHAFADGLRRPGGLSGYPDRAESEHDIIENSHASTALSYADGIAKALELHDARNRAVVAVVGDGAMTGGMAFEALNNIGAAPQRPVIIVLNDNHHSYSPTVGALAHHLTALRAAPLGAAMPMSPNIFQLLGLDYIGPIDGHDIAATEAALRRARGLSRPVVVHVETIKGHGHHTACAHAERMHAVEPLVSAASKRTSWTEVFAEELVDIGAVRHDIVAITAAMPGPTGLSRFAERFPRRCYDVGIAEQHAVTSAAGLAMVGLHPVVAIYSTFLNRAFDQVLLDVGLHHLPVTFVLDRAGVTGPDGPSHHGMWDLTLLATVPDMRVAAPRDTSSLRELLNAAVAYADGPSAVRFPKASVGPDIPAIERIDDLDVLQRADDPQVLIVAVGPLAGAAVEAAQLLAGAVGVTVVDPRWVLPPSAALRAECRRHRLIVVVEDNVGVGAVGAAIARDPAISEVGIPVHVMSLPHCYLGHGDRAEILTAAGLCATDIAAIARASHVALTDRAENS